jgi:hypothetical protein
VFTGTFISRIIACFVKTVVIIRGKNCSLARLYDDRLEGLPALRFPDYRATERTGGAVFERLKKEKFDE